MKVISLVLISLLLSGCIFTKEKIVTVTKKIPVECGSAPKVDSVKLLEVKPWVIQDKADIYWIAMTPKNYENIAENFAMVDAAIGQKNAVIKFYVTCIDNFNKEKTE